MRADLPAMTDATQEPLSGKRTVAPVAQGTESSSALQWRFREEVMQRAPLLPAAAGLIAGVVLDRLHPVGITLYACVFLIAGGAAAFRGVRRLSGPWLMLLAAACVGGVLHVGAARSVPIASIERYVADGGRLARVKGTIRSDPRLLDPPPNPFAAWNFGSRRTVFVLDVQAVVAAGSDRTAEGRDIPVTGRLFVSLSEPVPDLRAGEVVEVFGWLRPLEPARNPGSFDWSAHSRRQGIVATLYGKHRENIRRLETDPPQRHDLVTRFRNRLRAMLTDDLVTGAPEEASLLEAMILGHRSRLDRRMNELFIQGGCAHFLAVSGVHVVIVMFFLRQFGRALMLGPRMSTCALMAGVLVYAVVAEPRPPILRATTIAVIYCIARLAGREKSCMNWMSATAILFLLVDPTVIFDVGFQLSFAAVLGVSYLSPAALECVGVARTWCRRQVVPRGDLEGRPGFRPGADLDDRWLARACRGLYRFLGRYLRVGLAVAFGAWLAGLPIVAWHFHRVQPWGALSSMVALPLVSVVMALGFVKLIAGAILPGLTPFVAEPLRWADAALLWLVARAGALPGASVYSTSPPWWLLAAYYALLVAFALTFPREALVSLGPPPLRGQLRTPQPRVSSWWCGGALALLAVSAVAWLWPAAPGKIVVTVLAVGPGAATVIELPDGQAVLYDVGTRTNADVGRTVAVPYLRHRGIRRIERVYLSHANLDHFSGLPSVLVEIPTGPILVNEYFERRNRPRSPVRRLLELLAEQGRTVDAIDPAHRRWELGGATFELLAPPGGLGDSASANDTSTVLRIAYHGHSIMLTGDIEEEGQRSLLERACPDGGPPDGTEMADCVPLRADVLVLPHHGSVRPSSEAFIRAVGAKVLIRSSHESLEETTTGLYAITGGAPIYNTADVGAVRVVIDQSGATVRAMRPLPDTR